MLEVIAICSGPDNPGPLDRTSFPYSPTFHYILVTLGEIGIRQNTLSDY